MLTPATALGAALFFASLAMLGVEVAEVRILSYCVDPLLVFCAISVALLGLGAGGIAVAVRPSLARGEVGARLGLCLAGFALSNIVVHALFARLSERIGYGTAAGIVFTALPVFALLVVPFFFAGTFFAIAFVQSGGALGRAYALNLFGSAIGCVVLDPLLRPVGLEPVLAAFSALAAIVAVPLVPRSSPKTRVVTILVAAISLSSVAVAQRLFPFAPDPGDVIGDVRKFIDARHPEASEKRRRVVREFSRWDPVSRAEVYRFPRPYGLMNGRVPLRLFAQDGGAGSLLLSLGEHADMRRALAEGTLYGGAYAANPSVKTVLAIGLGGAPDIVTALHFGAEEIVGVEINKTTIDIVRGPYAKFLGDPYGDPRVTVIHNDGRSYVERTNRTWDLIQISGADTYAAGGSGAFMFSESYLYTREAFASYFRRLSATGVLAIMRFGLEPLRIVTSELEALRSAGIAHPERHLLVLGQDITANVIMSRAPFTEADVVRVEAAIQHGIDTCERISIPLLGSTGFGMQSKVELLYAPGRVKANAYGALMVAAARGRESERHQTDDHDFTPVPDDRPFFFQFLGLRQLPSVLRSDEKNFYARGFRAHLSFLAAIALAATALLLLPLLATRRARTEGEAPTGFRRARPPFGFFAAVGLGYLFVELTLMQRGNLLIGHPSGSVAITLVTLLTGSGVGSYLASRSARPPAWLASRGALLVAAVVCVTELAIGPLFALAMSWPLALRVAAIVFACLPAGLVMGVPFPSALRALADAAHANDAPAHDLADRASAPAHDLADRASAQHASRSVAWALATNSLASVVASLAAVPIAMFAGFRVLMATSAVLYLVAMLLAPRAQAARASSSLVV
ncbi:MAG: hypothetical protein EXR75_15725 [Myxococcales bacterium]|nr:hypothetical protein [Myxococcales bacterium]